MKHRINSCFTHMDRLAHPFIVFVFAVDYDGDLPGLLFLCLMLPSFHLPAFKYNWIWRSFTQLEIKWGINRYVCSLLFLNRFLMQS